MGKPGRRKWLGCSTDRNINLVCFCCSGLSLADHDVIISGFFRIDVLDIDTSEGTVGVLWTKEYKITWDEPANEQYLGFLLLDVSENGYDDLVALINTNDSTLTTVVFPNIPRDVFSEPVVSTISILKSLFNPTFFKSVLVKSASYDYLTSGVSIKTAILQLFDNYQLLGARLLAPVKHKSFQYELKGQTPSIAGQTTVGTGSEAQESGDWQGFFAKPI